MGHHANFGYRLLGAKGQTLWQRRQSAQAPSPQELYLAEDSWLVVRTHDYGVCHLIAISPTGDQSVAPKE